MCPFCGGVGAEAVVRAFLRCSECGAVLNTSRVPDDKALQSEWFEDIRHVQPSFWVRRFEQWNNRRAYLWLKPWLREGASILEVGIGSGSFLRFLRNRQFAVAGCELSRTISLQIEKQYGVKVYNCELSEVEPSARFSVIVMRHVIEHVRDPVQLIRDARARLEEGGVVFIATPNVKCWEARFGSWPSYESYHLVLMHESHLRMLASKADMRVVFERSHESFSGWFLTTLNALRGSARTRSSSVTRGGGKNAVSPVEHAYRLAMVLIGLITFPFRAIQGRLGFGDEITAVFRASGPK